MGFRPQTAGTTFYKPGADLPPTLVLFGSQFLPQFRTTREGRGIYNNFNEKTYKNINFYYIKMGVYIIKSIHSNWIKVGHHKISEKRPSVYYRYLNRGFYSCICPSDIKDKVSFDDIELLYWFPNLNSSDENRIHKYLKYWYSSIGEWYDFDILNNILKVICDEYGGISQMPTKEEYEEALTKRII